MQQVKVPGELIAKLDGLSFAAELCDEAGAPKAVVLPVEAYREMLLAWADAAFSPEDLAKARAEAGGYATAEAVEYLKKMVSERSKG